MQTESNVHDFIVPSRPPVKRMDVIGSNTSDCIEEQCEFSDRGIEKEIFPTCSCFSTFSSGLNV